VTENLLLRNFLARTAGSLSRVSEWQARISSGTKLLRPSDDPRILAKSLAMRADIRQAHAYQDNASAATTHMSLTEAALEETSNLLSRAKELLVQGMSDTAEAGDTSALAEELRAIVDELLLVANRDVAGRRLFGGTETRSAPYAAMKGRVLYGGNDGDILEELGPGLRVAINLTGPDAFQTVPSRIAGTVDLDPTVSWITPLADLLGGAGVSGGQIRLTDSNGVSADVDLMGATNLGQVVQAINNAGTAIVAVVSPGGSTVELADTGGGAGFRVEDLYGGTLAQGLGLAGDATGSVRRGVDLDPAVTEQTPVAVLLGGAGIGPGTWTIRNDSAGVARQAVIDPSQANTVGELLDLIEGATTSDGVPLGIRARVSGASLVLESTRLHTQLSVMDATGTSAAALGVQAVGEAWDVFGLLEDAAGAIDARDHDAMESLLDALTAAVENTAGVRGTYGARARQVLGVAASLDDQSVDLTIRLSDLEDVDLAQAALELTRAETVYNASLAVGTRLFERNLFDYFR